MKLKCVKCGEKAEYIYLGASVCEVHLKEIKKQVEDLLKEVDETVKRIAKNIKEELKKELKEYVEG